MAMVTLSSYEQRRIQYLLPPGGNQRIVRGAQWQVSCPGMNPGLNLACWNWCLWGLRDAPPDVDPQGICNYLNSYSHQPAPRYSAGKQQQIRNAWRVPGCGLTVENRFDNPNTALARGEDTLVYRNGIRQACLAYFKLVADTLGYPIKNSPTPYQLCMHYQAGVPFRIVNHMQQDSNVLIGPSYDHWWIEIHGVVFESWPNQEHLFGRNVAQYLEPGDPVVKIYVGKIRDLHRTKILQLLDELMQLNWPSWGQAQANLGAQPDTLGVCAICNTQVGFMTRHHCRRCGRLVCGSCSEGRRNVAHPVIPGTGQVRVCIHCDFA